ncbi:sensor histidine kinase [Ramlibacter tataouinensis]|uniref:histidine kinase n=1 Tax=Ramlibacter tataouinensis (strain ATCC BAA-407 / DSM 14655 / LMG 21543 / TTB310) TaxID=365046 RepID=F5Y212_RAMTT|nr:ATP-binding protein [Ramlibacter tataouinensis]AEG93596.1 candidate histidine kinase, classic [Ramlibacter tataouinensis TTB310]
MIATEALRRWTGAAPLSTGGEHPWTLLELVQDAAVVLAPDQTVRYWNSGARRMFGVDSDDALGRRFTQLLGSGAAPSPGCLAQLADTGSWEGEAEWLMPEGQVICVERRCAALMGDAGLQAILLVDTDVTERRRAAKEIVLLNNVLEQRIRSRTAELEESNEDLRGFAHSLAHDLRGPLSSIDGFSAQLQRRLDGQLDDQCRHYLERLRAGVQHMAGLTDALLALAELSGARPHLEQVDLSALAQASVDRLRRQPAQHQPAVAIEPTAPVQGDPELLSIVMDQLIGNAWKFTSTAGQGACIGFSGSARPDGSYVYEVKDNGVGFDPRYARKLFGPFQRLHAAGEFEGNGIGLAMVRKIVLRHGGRIWADSLPGQGASFSFTLAPPRHTRTPA